MNVQRRQDAEVKYEYGCDLRRIYPWVADRRALVWVRLLLREAEGMLPIRTAHDEFELFCALRKRRNAHRGGIPEAIHRRCSFHSEGQTTSVC